MTLTKEEAKEWIPILQAFVDGKKLQMWNGTTDEVFDGVSCTPIGIKPESSWVDIDTSQILPMTFSNHVDIHNPSEWFRVKPEPDMKPLSNDEMSELDVPNDFVGTIYKDCNSDTVNEDIDFCRNACKRHNPYKNKVRDDK